MLKKYIVMVVIIAMLFSVVACNKAEDEPTPVTQEEVQEEVAAIETVSTNQFGWEVPKEQIELTYYSKRQRNPDKEEAYLEMMHNYLLSEFNVNLNKIVYDTDPEERFNLMLATGDYPAVMTRLSKTDVLRLKELGIVVDMAPYIEEVGQNIKKELGDLYPRYVNESGEVLGLPYGWGLLEIPDYSAHIRYDYYDEMGRPEFETPYEYYEVIKDMIAKYPENENGEKVYALSWNQSGDDIITGINTIAGVWGLKAGYKEDDNHNLTHWIHTDEGKEFTAFYNQVHRDGLFDPDAFTNKYDDWKEKFSTERIMGHIGPWWQSWNAGHEVWQKADENWVEEKRYIQVKVKDSDAEMAYLSPKDTTGWGYTVITDKAENPAEIVKLFDFMMTPTGTRLMAWGVPNDEGSNWNITDSGEWSYNDKAKSDVVNATYDYEAHRYYGDNRYWLVHPQGKMSDHDSANAWIDQCFNDEARWKKVLNENMAGTIYDNSAMFQITFLPNDPMTVTKQQVEDTILATWTKTVMSNTEEEFEANYEAMVKQLEKAGINDLETYMTEKYKENLEKWNQ